MKKRLFDRFDRLLALCETHCANGGKLNMSSEDMLWLLGWPYLFPGPFGQLINRLRRKGFVLVPLSDRFQLAHIDSMLALRKLPSGKHLSVLKERPELEVQAGKIIRQLYETRFNNKARGAFYANRGDIAQICGEPILTQTLIYELARELDPLPLLRPQKTVVQGYILIDALDVVAVVEKKRVLRHPVLKRVEIEDALRKLGM